MILPLVVIILLIFLLTVSLSLKNITRFFARLGIVPSPGVGIMAFLPKNFTYTIPASQLAPGSVVGYSSNATDTAGNPNTTNIATFTVVYPETIHDLHFKNTSGSTITSIHQNELFYIEFNITNVRERVGYNRAYFIQLKDPDGVISILPIVSEGNILPGYEERNIQGAFTAGKIGGTGYYKAQIFILSQRDGFPIATSLSANLPVS